MKIAIANPYGTQPREVGVLAAAVRMLQDYGHEVVALGCDGCLTRCDRSISPQEGLRRRFKECFVCIKEQSHLMDALSVSAQPLSDFMSREILSDTYSLVMSCPANELPVLAHRGEGLAWLARHSFKARFGSSDAVFDNPELLSDVRDTMMNAARIVEAAIGFLKSSKPAKLIILGRDLVSEALMLAAKELNVPVARIIQNPMEESFQIFDSERGEVLAHSIYGLDSFRVSTPVSEWNAEFYGSVREFLLFLKIPVVQMNLFAANQA